MIAYRFEPKPYEQKLHSQAGCFHEQGYPPYE